MNPIESIPFDPMNPYPLFKTDSYTYQAAQKHAEIVDQWLGFQIHEIEPTLRTSNIARVHQTWSELSAQSFQTPYCEIRSLLAELNLNQNNVVADLGCAYGRMGFVIGRHYAQTQFLGYEIAKPRVLEAQRVLKNWQYPNVQIFEQNLTTLDFSQSPADCFFIYDFGWNPAIQKTLSDLKMLAQKKPITVVARGRATKHFVFSENPWLTVNSSPLNFDHFSIFKSS